MLDAAHVVPGTVLLPSPRIRNLARVCERQHWAPGKLYLPTARLGIGYEIKSVVERDLLDLGLKLIHRLYECEDLLPLIDRLGASHFFAVALERVGCVVILGQLLDIGRSKSFV